jgi:hypothetical protein
MLSRLRSPRRLIATTLAVVFFALFLLNGIVILSAREPADPARLQLWLSGGMVIYALYHFVRCVWSTRIVDLELTSAEQLWLGGAPVQRSSLAVYHIGNIVVTSLLKTLLLAVVLALDVNHLELLILGVFASLVLLETTRLLIQRWSTGLSVRRRRQMRMVATSIAVCVALRVLSGVILATPWGAPTWLYFLNTFQALGQTAASDVIQWLAIPWLAPAKLAVSEHYTFTTLCCAVASVSLLPVFIVLLVRTDAWANQMRLRREQRRLAEGRFDRTSGGDADRVATLGTKSLVASMLERYVPRMADGVIALIDRQAVSVRKYWGTIVISFSAPTVLCLAPLLTGRVTEQWRFVVGGIALCTMLLAPPALRLDFRRDLRRMLLLRSLPLRPLPMVVGQLALPVMITLAFQWLTIAIAAAVTLPGWSQVIMWTGMLGALAVATFAAENALFLAYPHHERAEGIVMMIRAKLTFLGKGTVIAIAVVALAIWVTLCQRLLPESISMPITVCGALLATWTLALAAVAGAAWCWKRFDLAYDVPPE